MRVPSLAKARAVASPMPLAPPVTMAILPDNLGLVFEDGASAFFW